MESVRTDWEGKTKFPHLILELSIVAKSRDAKEGYFYHTALASNCCPPTRMQSIFVWLPGFAFNHQLIADNR